MGVGIKVSSGPALDARDLAGLLTNLEEGDICLLMRSIV